MPSRRLEFRRGAIELEELLELMPDASVAVDVDGRIVATNPALCSLLGFAPEELAGELIEILVPEMQRASHATERHQFLGRPEERAMAPSRQLAARHRDGRAIDVLISLRPVARAEGQIVIAALRDISDLRAAERARRAVETELRRSEDRYRDLVENSLDLICTQDRDGNLLTVNQAAIELTGFSREALLQMNVADLLAPQVRGLFADYLKKFLAEGRATGLMKIQTATGEFRTWEYSNTLRTEGVSTPVIRGTARDITAARAAREAQRASEAKYRALIENMAEGLLVVDRDEVIRFVNPQACRMLGYPEAELLGREAGELLFREEDRAAMPARARRRAEGVTESYEIEVRTRSGEYLWTSFSVAPMASASGKFSGSMAILTDVTDRRRLEELSAGQRTVLELIAGGAPLPETLAELLRVVEAQHPEMLCSVLLLDRDGTHLRHGAAPSLPADYLRAIDGLAIGPSACSCGTSAFRRELVIVEDIASDPLWQDHRTLALSHGLRACWSSPVFDGQQRLLGTFAIYYRQPSRPTARHLRLIDIATQTAATAIRHEEAEAALRDSEARLRRIVDHIHDALYVDDADGKVIFANDQFLTLFGVEREQLPHLELEQYVAPEWRAAARDRHERRLRGEPMPSHFEYEGLRPDGGRLWLESTVVPLLDDAGRVIGTQSADRDISERKRAESSLRASEERYRTLFDRNLAGVFRTTLDGRILECNEAFARIYGYPSRDELLNASADALYATPTERADFLESLLATGVMTNRESEGRRKDGSSVWLLENVHLVDGAAPADGKLIEGTLLDISERKSMEEELRQSQKIEAIGRLAGGVAHDFNNILGVILGFGELAESDLEPESPAREMVAEIVKAAERAAALTRQLQAFSRKQVLQPKRLDLNNLVANAHKMLDRVIGEDIALVVRPAPGLGTVRADPGQIDQILLNLALNARDAMPNGGTLTLETANVDLTGDDYAMDRPAIRPGLFVMLALSDTGSGMDAETKRRIFEPFFTTKSVGQGTGLGLATVYGIVKQSEGYIWVYSEPGLGTTFKIYLPRIDEPPEAASPAHSSEPVAGGRETILLVEDNPALRETIRRRLEALGYTVLAAGDGEEALALAADRIESIDLLLTDIVMPKLGGGALAHRLRARRAEIRVLFMSGYTDGAIAQRGELEAGVLLLEKPFSGAKLVRAVRAALDGEGDPPSDH